jgi:spore maturation protein CgeB
MPRTSTWLLTKLKRREAVGRIVCLSNYNQYESKRCFTEDLAKELRLLGHTVSIFDADRSKGFGAFVVLAKEKPDLVFTFHSLLPLPDGSYPWDVISSPFFCALLDPAIYSMPVIQSKQCFVGTIDRDDLATIQTIQKEKRSLFFPHAVDKERFSDSREEKQWEAVFLGSCYDYEGIEKLWKERYPSQVVKMLHDAAEMVFADSTTALYEAFAKAAKEHAITADLVNFRDAFYEWDIYVRGKERIQLLKSFKNIEIQVFGDPFEAFPGASRSFSHYLADCKNITLHPAVSYRESFAIQRKAKFTLNSSIMYKNGSHERLFTPAACSSLLVTSDGPFVQEVFSEGQVVINPSLGYEQLEERVQKVAQDPFLYEEMLEAYRKKIEEEHTWKQRALLLSELL